MDLGVGDVHVPGAGSYTRPARRRPLEMTITHPDGHKIEVRHLRDDVLVGDSSEIDAALLLDSGPKLIWNQIAKPGTFRGHGSGPFQLDAKVFDEIIRNFKADGKPVQIDFEHASEMEPTEGTIPESGAPAQGWIHDLKVEGGNLYGLVEWLEPARGYIKANKYKYFSPAIRFNSKDRVTGQPVGARLTSGAITNGPFLVHMAPLAASDGFAATSVAAGDKPGMKVANYNDFAPKLRMALKLSPTASMRECSDELARLSELYSTAPHAHAMHQGVDLGMYTSGLCSLMSMPANADVDELLDAVQEMIDAAIERHEAVYHAGVSVDNADGDGGDETMTAADTAPSTEGADTMSAEFIARLKDTEEKLATLTSRYESEKAELTLKLTSAEAKNAALETQVVQLKEAETRRDAETKAARVDEAFVTHKDTQKLTDAHRPMMASFLATNPGEFEKLYPRVAPDQRHMLRQITPVVLKNDGSGASGGKSGTSPTLSFRQLAQKIAVEKKIPLGLAQLEAEKVFAAVRKSA
jgi:phage I-like protein